MRVPAPRPDLATERARRLRRDATPAEQKLWNALRGRAVNNLRVKRQVPFGPYILDFAIPERCLVIELDGESHFVGYGPSRDCARDAFLAGHGWRVLRLLNADVLGNLEGVLTVIAAAALGPHPHPNPLPQAGEGVR